MFADAKQRSMPLLPLSSNFSLEDSECVRPINHPFPIASPVHIRRHSTSGWTARTSLQSLPWIKNRSVRFSTRRQQSSAPQELTRIAALAIVWGADFWFPEFRFATSLGLPVADLIRAADISLLLCTILDGPKRISTSMRIVEDCQCWKLRCGGELIEV